MSVKDHKGKEFKSYEEMAKAYGINLNTFNSRRQKGLSIQQALEAPRASFQDHKGNQYKSFNSMAKAYNLSDDILMYRLVRGWSIKDALETPSYRVPFVTDHKGNNFGDYLEMARAYGIGHHVLKNRIYNKWDLESALTIPVKQYNMKKKVTDHLGNIFNSYEAMYEYYGITRRIYWHRTKVLGMSIKEALETPVTDTTVTDHLGLKHSSLVKMAKAYNIDEITLRSRVKSGWGLKEALETPEHGVYKVKDHLGNEYSSLTQMAKTYGQNKCTVRARLKAGWNLEKALTTPAEKRVKHSL